MLEGKPVDASAPAEMSAASRRCREPVRLTLTMFYLFY